MIGRALELTFTAIFIYLVLSRAGAFAKATAAVGEFYTSSIKTLQGR